MWSWYFTMSESGQRKHVIKALKPIHAVAVENPVGPGTPDVNYCEGWIELKWLRTWPKRDATVVSIPHFTIQQRRWLRRRWEVGQSAWLLLQIKREWMLFTGLDAHDYVGNLNRKELREVARVRWQNGINATDLCGALNLDWDSWDGLPVVRPYSWRDAAKGRHSKTPLKSSG